MPSILTNRVTRQSFFVENQRVVSPVPSFQIEENTPFQFEELLEFIQDIGLGLDSADEISLIQVLSQEYESQKSYYDELFTKPETVEKVYNEVASKAQKEKDDHRYEYEAIKTILSGLIFSNFGIFGGILLHLVSSTSAFPVSSAVGDIIPHDGQPEGGIDLCAGTIWGCGQGHVTRGNATFQPTDSQYARIINEINADNRGADLASRMQLRDCFHEGTLGELVVKVLSQNQGDSRQLQSCTTSSTAWRGWSIDTTTTNVPGEVCPTLQNEINAAVQGCKSSAGALRIGGIIAGITIGSVVGLALIVCAGWYIATRCQRSSSPDMRP